MIKSIEKFITNKIGLYLIGIIAGLIFQIIAINRNLKPESGWGVLMLISLLLFTYSKMGSPVAPLCIVWGLVSIFMFSPAPPWMVITSGALLFIIIEPLFKRPSIENQDMPPKSAIPILKESFFSYAEKGLESGKFFLGEKVTSKTPVWLYQGSLVEHMQIVGITRCGKSHFQNSISYQGMIRNWSVIYITGKPSAVDWGLFWYLANRSGRAKEVRYFDPLDEKSGSLNPISPVGHTGTELEAALQIMRAIGREPPATQERSDAFYKSADFSRLLDLSSIFVRLEKPFTLKDCYQFFSDASIRQRVFDEAVKKGLLDVVSRMRNAYNLQNRRLDSLEGITAQLRPWIAEPINSKVENPTPSISIVQLLKEGGLLYCALSPARLHSQANSLGRQITAQIFAASEMFGSQHVERPPVLMILDEFQEYLAPFFSTMISQAGGREVCIVLAHQDFSQLQRVEGIDKKSFSANVTNNTATKIFFSTRSVEDADNMSSILGTRKVMKRSRSMSIDPLGDAGYKSISEREGEEFIVHPNWFKVPKKFLAASSTNAGNDVIRTTLFDIEGIKLPAASGDSEGKEAESPKAQQKQQPENVKSENFKRKKEKDKTKGNSSQIWKKIKGTNENDNKTEAS